MTMLHCHKLATLIARVLSLLVLLAAATATAQDDPSGPVGEPVMLADDGAAPDPEPVRVAQTSGDLRLQPGDELILLIPEMGDRGERRVVVDADGEISLGIYGRAEVGGLTEDEALDVLRSQLRPYLRSTAGVLITLERRQQLVLVTGRVATPGLQTVGAQADVWMAIQAAGGAADGADLSRVTLVRDNDETAINVRDWLVGRDHGGLPVLQPGDTVFVPAHVDFGTDGESVGAFLDDETLSGKVIVLGAVGRPGIYDRFDGIDVLTALALAGGPTVDADVSLVRVITVNGSERVDLTGHLLGERVDISLPSAGGSIVWVPAVRVGDPTEFADGVTVIGAFNGAGHIELRQPIDMAELLGRAGGPTATSNLRRLSHIQRYDGVTIASQYSLRRFVRRGTALGDVTVHPGDVIFLGEDLDSGWEQFIGAVSDVVVVASAAVLIITLRDALQNSN